MPYNVNVAALVAVEESLKDIDYLKRNVASIVSERARLFEELKKIKWLSTIPSQANFILCKVEKGEAGELKQKLQQKGILIRYFQEGRMKDYVRISVGKPEHTDALIHALSVF
jgi:histidinol-phosphate aminotransferase